LQYQHAKRRQVIADQPRRNEAIRGEQFRVIADDGAQLGILSKEQALKMARDAGQDLVEVSALSKPPVVKMVDWGKYNYQRTKQLQKSRKKAKALDVKQIRMGLKIGEHDLDIKLRKATEFLEAGHKVKVTLVYRGRELAHKEVGNQLADKIIQKLSDRAVVDQPPQFAGRQLSFVVRKSNAKVKDSQIDSEASSGPEDR
jgi:translation initiation factor IF-3